MSVLLGGVYVGVLVCLLLVLGVHPQLSSYRRQELRRRAKTGDTEAKLLLKRRQLLRDLFSLQRVVAAVLLVVLSVLGVELFHWLVGIAVSLFVALESGAVARLGPLQRYSQRLYQRYEGKLLVLIEQHPLLFRAIRSVAPLPSDGYDIESRQELLAMVRESGDALRADEKALIVNGLNFATRRVADIMTPQSVMRTIDQQEVLGPVVLDELHQTGHSRFPVTDGDQNHIVGMLYVQDLVGLHQQEQPRVSSLMDQHVYYIRQQQTLRYALAAFLRTRHHLFIVINQYRETVGLLSLEDVIEALLGRSIMDECDTVDDLRQQAVKQAHQHNNAAAGRDV